MFHKLYCYICEVRNFTEAQKVILYFYLQSKRKRLPSSHSDNSNLSSKMKSPLASPKNKVQDISIKDSNPSSDRKRKSRTPEPPKKSKPRIHQEGNFNIIEK